MEPLIDDVMSVILSFLSPLEQFPLPFVCKRFYRFTVLNVKPKMDEYALACGGSGHLTLLQWASSQLNCILTTKIYASAAKESRLEVMKWLRIQGVPMDYKSWEGAVESGDFKVLEWLLSQRCTMEVPEDYYNTSNLSITIAIKQKRWDIVKWLRENGMGWGNNGYKCENWYHTAGDGNIEMLDWLKREGAPWDGDETTGSFNWPDDRNQFEKSVEVMKWLIAEGCPFIPSVILRVSAGRGHLEILKYMIEELKFELDPEVCIWAAEEGYLEPIIWLRSIGCDWNERVFRKAVRNGHWEIIKYCRLNDCPWGKHVFSHASRSTKPNRLEVMKYLKSEGCPWDELTFKGIAKTTDIEAMEWLYSQGCPFSEKVTEKAACNRQWECFKWLVSHGCPWGGKDYTRDQIQGDTAANDKTLYLDIVVRQGAPVEILEWLRDQGGIFDVHTPSLTSHMHVMEWLWKQKCPFNHTAYTKAFPDLKKVKWLRSKGVAWNETTPLIAIQNSNGIRALQWVISEGCPYDREEMMKSVMQLPNKEIFLWLRSIGVPYTKKMLDECKTYWTEEYPFFGWIREQDFSN